VRTALAAEVVHTSQRAALTVKVSPALANPLGNLHGGISLWLAELAGDAALRGEGTALDTATVHVTYLRPVPLGTTIRVTATAVHRGRTFGVAQVVGTLPDGRHCTVATVTGRAS
jgi:uncharacterized protein (TIGR00369 family)